MKKCPVSFSYQKCIEQLTISLHNSYKNVYRIIPSANSESIAMYNVAIHYSHCFVPKGSRHRKLFPFAFFVFTRTLLFGHGAPAVGLLFFIRPFTGQSYAPVQRMVASRVSLCMRYNVLRWTTCASSFLPRPNSHAVKKTWECPQIAWAI